MTPFLRKFSPDYANSLIGIAAEDLKTAELLVGKDTRRETLIFMVQQAVEKSLKAVICYKDKPVPMIHDIAGLLSHLPQDVPRPPNEESLEGLTEYATVRRYEEGYEEISDKDVKAAITAGQALVKWAQRLIH